MRSRGEYFEDQEPESILERQEIVAPPNFVSVFHETGEKFLSDIDQDGLKGNTEEKNIGAAKAMANRNAIIDQHRPEELRSRGISRQNIYAYPFLEYGHGLLGADQRFIERDEQSLRWEFEDYGKYGPDFLKKLGVSTVEEYIAKMTNQEYLKSRYPGEVLELKVDPQKCYVGDLNILTGVIDMTDRGWSEDEALQQLADEYWENLMTLEVFLKWYRKPEWTEDEDSVKDGEEYRDGEPSDTSGFYPIKGAPASFPWHIYVPEVLIPENIPQAHIRLVKDQGSSLDTFQ